MQGLGVYPLLLASQHHGVLQPIKLQRHVKGRSRLSRVPPWVPEPRLLPGSAVLSCEAVKDIQPDFQSTSSSGYNVEKPSAA